jgi:Phosphotransferase enzyme family
LSYTKTNDSSLQTSAAALHPEDIPPTWSQVTPEWLTAALNAELPDVKVADVELVTQDDGTNRRARFRMRYAEGSGPEFVFLKAHASDHRAVHLRNGNLWNEARLFSSGQQLPLDHPRVYKSIIDLLGLDFLLVMEDLRERGADPRDSTRPMTVEQVADGLRGLARLHSRYWGFTASTHPELDWVETWAPTEGWQFGLRKHVPRGLERGSDSLPPSISVMTGDEIVAIWSRYVGTLAHGPVTLLHGDAHIGNTYVLPQGSVGFLDWQVVRRGGWSQDVGYFLIGSLSEADRRAHERELIEIYRRALTVPDDQRPSLEDAWLIYRATPSYGLGIWLSTLGTDGYQRFEVSLALAERFACAFVELGTLAALAEIGA